MPLLKATGKSVSQIVSGLTLIIFANQTIGYDPLVPVDEAAKYNIEWMELDKLWPKADYITVHTPLIPQTKGRGDFDY